MKIIIRTTAFLGEWKVHYILGDPAYAGHFAIIWLDTMKEVLIYEGQR